MAEKRKEKLTLKEDNVKDSIANITEAIFTVVTHSTNDQFRQKCFSLLQVANSSGLASSLSSQLQSIAHGHIGITWSDDMKQTGPGTSGFPAASHFQDATSTQLEDQAETQRVFTESDDIACKDLAEFLQIDFSEDEPCATSAKASLTCSSVEENAAVDETKLEPEESLEVLQSTLGKDWFDEVIDEDLLFNES